MRYFVCVLALAGCFDTDSISRNPPVQNLVDDWRDEIIYQIVTDRFADGDYTNDYGADESGLALARYQGGDWKGIQEHLDYVEALGVTALWISPVVRNVEEDAGIAGYHGYWTQNFLQTNPHFGDLTALRELVAECHRRKIKVILDIVVNHIGQLFYYDINENGRPDDVVIGTGGGGPLGLPPGGDVGHLSEFDPDYDPRGIQAATALGSAGPAPIRFFYVPDIDRMPPEPAVFQNPAFYHKRGRIYDYTSREQVLFGDFPGGLKDLATENPDVVRALENVYEYWADAVDFDGFRIDTVKHVDHPFWQQWGAGIRDHQNSRGKKNFLMFGEVFDGDDAFVASYTQNGELDSVQDFPHKYTVVNGVLEHGGATKAVEQLRTAQAADFPSATAPILVRFLDTHDGPRFLFDTPDPAILRQALGYLLTADGIPSIYYGTEQEFHGGNDPTNRERLWPTGFATGGTTFQWIAQLTRLRSAHESLRRGDLTIRWSTVRVAAEEDAGILAFERSTPTERFLVVLNVSDLHSSHTSFGGAAMKTGFPGGTTLHTIFGTDTDTVQIAADQTVTIEMPSRGFRVYAPQ